MRCSSAHLEFVAYLLFANSFLRLFSCSTHSASTFFSWYRVLWRNCCCSTHLEFVAYLLLANSFLRFFSCSAHLGSVARLLALYLLHCCKYFLAHSGSVCILIRLNSDLRLVICCNTSGFSFLIFRRRAFSRWRFFSLSLYGIT